MKRFLINILIGTIVFLAVWISSEYAFEQLYIQNNYSYKYSYVKNNSAIKTLLIGHSQFENGINPYLMGDSIFDFAISGRRWIYWDVKLAEQLFHTMPNCKTVIFPLAYEMPYESWHYRPISEYDIDYAYNYAKHMHVYYDRFPEKFVYASALLNNKMNFEKMVDIAVNPLGYDSITVGVFHENLMKPDTNVYRGETSKLCYREYCAYLKQLAKICYDNDIRFIVVTTPCANCYVQNTREEGIRNLYALIDSVRQYYPIEYYNYIADDDFRSDSLFFDGYHLNSYGADKFAIRLKRDIKL